MPNKIMLLFDFKEAETISAALYDRGVQLKSLLRSGRAFSKTETQEAIELAGVLEARFDRVIGERKEQNDE